MTNKKRERPPRVAFFGAAPDTPNMGVSALFYSTLYLLRQRIPDLEFVVFDNGLGERECTFEVPELGSVRCTLYGARPGRRYYRPENLATMCVAARFGGLGKALNRAIQLLDSCDAVIDISGGDSFSDIYGKKRFLSILRPKILASRLGKPLILLPQTYGPFSSAWSEELARQVLVACDSAWSRDELSFQKLCRLMGDLVNDGRCRSGVDMAFGLPPACPDDQLDEQSREFIERISSGRVVVGFNVSGLIFNDSRTASKYYGFKSDYRTLVVEFLQTILSERQEVDICLIPHVLAPVGHYESDIEACRNILDELSDEFPGRLLSIESVLDQSRLKAVISRMAWFCGTRMHSTVAALSSGVPCASIVYSDKARGIFSYCGLEKAVCDPRDMDAQEITQKLIELYDDRAACSATLSTELPEVHNRLSDQVESIARSILRE